MQTSTPRIQFDAVTKTYPGVRALDAVSFDVSPGCVHAIVGENGAGKSTLMKILAGATRADAGTIRIDGRPVAISNARDAQARGIAIVYQEFNLAPHLSVSENVFLGRWPRRKWSGLVRFAELHERTTRLFRDVGLDVPVRARVETLSVAQQQMVEIAKALSHSARVLILDEPSAVLTPKELATLFRVVREMTARGVTVLYISHRLDEIFELADSVTVLRDGRHVSTRPIRVVDRRTLISETVGRPLEEEFPARESRPGEARLSVRDLSAPGRFAGVSFDLRAGEVVALTGMVGSSRSSVAKALFGAIGSVSGTLRAGAMRGPFRSPAEAKRAGIAFLPEDRKREGLLLARPTRENVTLAHMSDVSAAGFFIRRRERSVANALMSRLGIRGSALEEPAGALSGGNQQKAMLARWLQRPCDVIILDEPTRGVDVGAKFEIYAIINDLATRGAAVLMISSELPEVIGMADRIGVMCRGRLVGILDNAGRAVTQEAILRLAVGEAHP